MKLLVTGGLGFIGSNFIVKTLQSTDNFEIINVDAGLFGSDKKNLHTLQKNQNYKFIKGNITDRALMERLITKCDAVVNFAAESFVDRSINDVEPFLSSNIHGVYTILNIITKQKKRLVQISTDEVFGSIVRGTTNEESKLNASNPYAATKAAAEILVNSYHKTYGSDVIITRCTNNYGPRQFVEKLIPKTILLAHKNNKIPIYGDGKNIRDWIFVDDHCDAVLLSLLHGKAGNSYNIAANNEVDNLTIVKKILKMMNRSLDLIEYVEDRPGHDFRYSMSSKKISTKLGWKKKTKFEDGLKVTIKWYLENIHRWKRIPPQALDKTPWKPRG